MRAFPKTKISTLKYLSFFILAGIIFSFSQAEARKKKFKGVIIVNQILKLTGTITNNGNPAPEFSGVKEGDLLETGDKSSAVIRIPGLAIMQLGERTKIKLTKFSNRDKSKFQIFSGNVLFLYKRLGDHEVVTPQSIVVPQGTGGQTFMARVSGNDDVISLWDGKVLIKSSATAQPAPAILANKDEKAESGKTAQLLPEKASDAPKGMNVAANAPKTLPHEMDLATQKNFKQVVAGAEGLTTRTEPDNLPDLKAAQDLESLYALP